MAFKEFQLPGIGPLKVYKRRGTNNIRLSIRSDGSVRVTIPTWTPYTAGITFARTRDEWIRNHQLPTAEPLRSGQQIGKAHRLLFVRSPEVRQVTTRLRQSLVVVTHPLTSEVTDVIVQQAAQKAATRGLRAEAEQLLPIRVRELAERHGFNYRSVSIKQLKTRWGSCDQHQNIVLNLYLMKLPWQLIDYVILHELTHTQVLQHGPKFWTAMARVAPNVQQLRKAMREHQPTL